MADNQIVDNSNETIVPETESVELTVSDDSVVTEKPKKGGKFIANLKEWFRKFIVKLKRKTQIIPFFLTLVTSFVFLCMIGTFSQLIQVNSGIPSLGVCMFVSTLSSILVLPLFLNAFPKNKKPVIPFIVAVFVVFALIIAMDIVFLVNMQNFFKEHSVGTMAFYNESQTSLICHIVLVGVCVLAFALLPVYKRAINKINTKKVVSSNDFSGEIDTSAEV